jgi:hypothetical protein
MTIHLTLKPIWSVLGRSDVQPNPAASPMAADTSNVMCAADVVRELSRATSKEQFLEAIPHIRDGHAMRTLATLYISRSRLMDRPRAAKELMTWVGGPLARRGSLPAWQRAITAVTDKLSAFVQP